MNDLDAPMWVMIILLTLALALTVWKDWRTRRALKAKGPDVPPVTTRARSERQGRGEGLVIYDSKGHRYDEAQIAELQQEMERRKDGWAMVVLGDATGQIRAHGSPETCRRLRQIASDAGALPYLLDMLGAKDLPQATARIGLFHALQIKAKALRDAQADYFTLPPGYRDEVKAAAVGAAERDLDTVLEQLP